MEIEEDLSKISDFWKTEHPYYGTGNYEDDHKTFQEYLNYWKEYDDDLNLVYRWDVYPQRDEDDDKFIHPKDEYYRSYDLEIFRVLQRKGYIIHSTIKVCRADEKDIKDFLNEKWDYFKQLWKGL